MAPAMTGAVVNPSECARRCVEARCPVGMDRHMKGTVIIIGGGWAGSAAALAAKRGGAGRVVILERTDMLLGCGLAGGIMRNNGRQTAAEELTAMGAGGLFSVTDSVATHKNVDFPGHAHAWLYSTTKIEPAVRRFLEGWGIEIHFRSRAVAFLTSGASVRGVTLHDPADVGVEGDVFVDATGSAGSLSNCMRYGNGCAMCVLRCPVFGPRISLTASAGLTDYVGMRCDGQAGSFSGSFELRKSSLSGNIRKKLHTRGVAVVPLPAALINREKLRSKSCQQYALREYASNLILLDTGDTAKIMTPFLSLEDMRRIAGFENAMIATGSGHTNSVRFLSRAPRNNALKVEGFHNLFCAGEKSGFFVGHTEAIATGSLAGHNAVRTLMGKHAVILPQTLACGDIIHAEQEGLSSASGLVRRYTFSGGEYFDRMREKGLYTTQRSEIANRVRKADCYGLFMKTLS